MLTRRLIYGALCLVALLYLGAANARGYVPFAAPITKAVDHNASHYHK
jgi:hypothetical protein